MSQVWFSHRKVSPFGPSPRPKRIRRRRRFKSAVAYVQSTHNAATAVSSLAKAFTSNNGSGNCLIACVGVWKSATFNDPTLTDTKGNTWKLLLSTPKQFASGQSCAFLFVAYNCAAGANTVTATVGVSSDIDIAIHEYSGVATVKARDQIAAGSNNSTGSGGSILAGTLQTQFANEVLVSFAYDQSHSTQTYTPSSGWTAREQTNNPGAESLATFDRIASATGTFSNSIVITTGLSHGLHSIIVSLADTTNSDDLVQSARSSGNVSSLTVVFPASNVSGNLLFLAIGRWSSTTIGTISSITDTRGNTWTLVGSTTMQTPSGHGQSQAHLYMCASCAAGANTVTVVTSSTEDIQLIAIEYSPHTITTQISNSEGTGASSIASGNIAASSLAVSLAYNQSAVNSTLSDFSGTGWKQRVIQGDSVGTTLSFFDQILSTPATLEQTITTPTSSFGLHVLVAAKLGKKNNIMEFVT